MPDALTLKDVLEAVEAQGTIIAFDMGEHWYCTIDSNCPKAVALRRILGEAKIEWEKLERYQKPENVFANHEILRPLTAKVTLGGQEIDLSNLVNQEAVYQIQRLIDNATENRTRVSRLGDGFYATYIQQLREARKTTTLPQLHFPIELLLSLKCTIGIGDDKRYYQVGFECKYAPKWLYTTGKRYEISATVAKTLERDAILVFYLTRDRKLLAPILLKRNGQKLNHYHGYVSDCWGTAKMIERWDGSLQQLWNQFRLLTGALTTINLDSLMSHQPDDMPHVDELKRHSVIMGEEGKLDATPEPAASGVNRGWGRIPTGGRP
jgi:hypothetical protein